MKCKKCGKEHDGTLGSGRFCSRSCANSRIQTKKQNDSRSLKLKRHDDKYCIVCGKKLYKNNITGYCSKHHYTSTSFRQKISKANKGKCGGPRHGGGRGKSGWYNNIKCDSSWELAFVLYCISNGIDIKRNNKKFEYIFNGETHNYYPDFIVHGTYIEIKGYWNKQFEAKLKHFPDNLNIEIFDEKKISPILKWTKERYGNDFIKLYTR